MPRGAPAWRRTPRPKAALTGMARSLGAEVRPLGVNVAIVCPGHTETVFPASATVRDRRGPWRPLMMPTPGVDVMMPTGSLVQQAGELGVQVADLGVQRRGRAGVGGDVLGPDTTPMSGQGLLADCHVLGRSLVS